MSYYDKETGSSVWRSGQPSPGIMNNICQEDIDFLKYVSSETNKLLVLDCRPKSAAMGNRVKGGGYENTDKYHNSSIFFGNIPNIHGVRDSFNEVLSACREPKSKGFAKKILDSEWLGYLTLILEFADRARIALENKSTCLIHCTDGWDRSSQICALAQLLFDPYYRTFEGFEVLIEKDFAAFGHPFAFRTGISYESSSDDFSPIFIQFLDVIHQLMFQFPDKFEFNSNLLLVLAKEVNTGRFGNFLFNTYKEREQHGVTSRSSNIWEAVRYLKDKCFVNTQYKPSKGSIQADCSMIGMRIWYEYFLPSLDLPQKRYLTQLNPKYEDSKQIDIFPLKWLDTLESKPGESIHLSIHHSYMDRMANQAKYS